MQWWQNYSFQRGLQSQHLSPFETNIVGSLFKDSVEKVKHKIQDNFWMWAPAMFIAYGTLTYVNHLRADYLLHHRD